MSDPMRSMRRICSLYDHDKAKLAESVLMVVILEEATRRPTGGVIAIIGETKAHFPVRTIYLVC